MMVKVTLPFGCRLINHTQTTVYMIEMNTSQDHLEQSLKMFNISKQNHQCKIYPLQTLFAGIWKVEANIKFQDNRSTIITPRASQYHEVFSLKIRRAKENVKNIKWFFYLSTIKTSVYKILIYKRSSHKIKLFFILIKCQFYIISVVQLYI